MPEKVTIFPIGLAAGHTREELDALIEGAPDFVVAKETNQH